MPLLLNLSCILIFVVIARLWVFGALLSILVANVFTAVYSLYLVNKSQRITIKFDPEIMKSILQLGAVFAIAWFLLKLNFRIDILILQALAPLREVGFYNQGVTVAEGWQAPFAIGAVILSSSANSTDQEVVNDNVAKLFRLTLLMVIISSVMIFLLSPFLVPLIYGHKFIPSVRIVQSIIPAIVVVIMAKILASRLAGLKKTYIVIFVHLPALIINIICNLILIPKYYAMGAVYSSIISYSFTAIGILLVYSMVVKRPVFDVFRFKKNDFDFIPQMRSKLSGMLWSKRKFQGDAEDSNKRTTLTGKTDAEYFTD
jgi:O-antigen/teichoic acid export membrane protein